MHININQILDQFLSISNVDCLATWATRYGVNLILGLELIDSLNFIFFYRNWFK